MAAPAQQSPVDASTYPRVAALPDGRVEIHHPTILDWAGFRVLTGRAAVVVETGSEARRRVGSLSFAAATTVHFSQRLVEVSDVEVTALSFEGQAVAEPLAEQVRAAVARDDQWITLDFLLRSLPADFQPPGQSLATPQLRFDPPRVVVSERSMRLMLFDGPPVGIRIEGTDLEYIVNTDLDLFHDLGDDHWYLLDEGSWLGNRMLASGDWRPINNLPDDFLNLQVSGAWPQVAAALPPTMPANPPVPFTVSYEPAELVLIDGEARLEEIPGTALLYVSNTLSDLFVHDGRYYLLVSGRWFTTTDFKRQWSRADRLPDDFSRIPAGHAKAHVLASVPGTEEARLSMIEAAIPRTQVLSMDAGEMLAVPYAGEPAFVEIPGTPLRRAMNSPFAVIRHNNFYYLCHEGAWYVSAQATGPWKPALQVPEAIYGIPPSDPLYPVTFVRLESFDDSSGRVAYRQTGGYRGSYWTGSTVVYGTGWHYPGYYGPAGYWRYPPTYGYGAWYNPVYGRYGYRGAYGGAYAYPAYSTSATYTLRGDDTDWSWGPEGSRRKVSPGGSRNRVGSGEYEMPQSNVYRGDGKQAGPAQAPQPLAEQNNGADDYFTGPGNRVYRRAGGDWELWIDGAWVRQDNEAMQPVLEELAAQDGARSSAYRSYDLFRSYSDRPAD